VRRLAKSKNLSSIYPRRKNRYLKENNTDEEGERVTVPRISTTKEGAIAKVGSPERKATLSEIVVIRELKRREFVGF